MDTRALFEDFLNGIIEREFTAFLGAQTYRHTDGRKTINGHKVYRNGYRTRKLNTTLGTIILRIPRTNSISFTPSFLERYKRNTDELNNLIKQLYVNGVSTAKVNNCTKALNVNHISKSQVSQITNHNIKLSNGQDLINKQYDAIYIDATFEKARVRNKVQFIAMITILGYTDKGYETIAVYPMPDESYKSYSHILNDLKYRGLKSPQLIISDYALGLINAIKVVYPNAKHQRCKVHFMRNICQHINNKVKHKLAYQIAHIWHTSNPHTAMQRANDLYQKYRNKYPKAMTCLINGIESTLTYMLFDSNELCHKRIETTNPIERINREFKRRTKSIGIFPSVNACYKLYMLITASLRMS